ncbi:MAG: hypothetical protein HY903_07900 [Deltaproteobacteria bacterium]|nr:hypothetical protein [Deltaproteobacteria bacterium]
MAGLTLLASSASYGANAHFDILTVQTQLGFDPSAGTVSMDTAVTIRASATITQAELDLWTLSPPPILTVTNVSSMVYNPNGIGFVLPATLNAGDTHSLSIHTAGTPSCAPKNGSLPCAVSSALVYFTDLDLYLPRNPWEPDAPGDVGLDVVTPPGQVAVAAALPVQVEDHGSYLRHRFRAWPESRIAALAVAPYQAFAATTIDATPVVAYVHDGQTLTGQAWAELGAAAIDFFADRFGPFGYGRLDLLQTAAGVNGAMSFGSAILFDQIDFHAGHRDPQVPYADMLFTHEVSHSWWGAALRLRDADSPWLLEGFATYSAYLFEEQRWPELMPQLYRSDFEQFFFMLDPAHERPLTSPSWDTADPLTYALVTYTKGGHFLRMLQWLMGDAAFFEGLGYYVQTNVWSAAHQGIDVGRFRAAMELASGRNLATIFDLWVFGTGFPILRYAVQLDPGAAGVFPVRLHVEQIQAGPLFTELSLPVSIWVVGAPQPRTARIEINQAISDHTIVVDAEPLAVAIDPSWWLWADKRPALVGDVDASNQVDGIDLIHTAWALGASYPAHANVNEWHPSSYLWDADFNRDAVVDQTDLDRVLQAFGAKGVVP